MAAESIAENYQSSKKQDCNTIDKEVKLLLQRQDWLENMKQVHYSDSYIISYTQCVCYLEMKIGICIIIDYDIHIRTHGILLLLKIERILTPALLHCVMVSHGQVTFSIDIHLMSFSTITMIRMNQRRKGKVRLKLCLEV